MELLEALRSPGDEFSPIPFWFLNGDLKRREIRRQLEDFRAHGVAGVVLHPRMGLPKRIGYLSETYFGYIRAALVALRELGMRAVFYDEGMYPSGSASGKVTEGHPELRSLGVTLTESVLAGDQVLARRGDKCLVVRPSGGTIRGVHFGEDDGQARAPASADILNPEAVARFIRLTHEEYYRRFGEYFGNTVLGFFTDEPSVLGRCVRGFFPWTRGFGDIFRAAGGRFDDLFALFDREETPGTALYRELITKRENDVYYAALSSWCEARGVALMGHPERSDDMERERHFHIPGQDLVYRQVSPEAGDLTGRDSVQGKCSADAARLLGRRRNSSECLGVCGGEDNPWSMTGADVKWFLDYLAVRGVNLFIPHAFYYSVSGRRRDERPPDAGPHNIWWPHYDKWSTYMRRLSFLMTDNRLCARAAVLCRDRDLMPEAVAELFRRQIGFQYIPPSFRDECRAEGGALTLRGHEYAAVIDPDGAFPGVSREVLALKPDILCDPPQPDLRAMGFSRLGVRCVLLVNAGEGDIRASARLPFPGKAGCCDLWTGQVRRFDGQLVLPRRGSLLLFACTGEEYDALPEQAAERAIPAPEFRLVSQDPAAATKTYEARLGRGSGVLTVRAEEMAELEVNGVPAGASFWSPHKFDLTGLLTRKENVLRLTVTGSRANLYGKPVPYGLKEE